MGFKLPFGYMPGHWGLKGKTREIAKAEYELEGEELDRALAKIETTRDLELQIRLLEIDQKYGKLTVNQFDKTLATLKKEPYVRVVDSGIDPSRGPGGFIFELDYNSYFVEFLKAHGIEGRNDDQIVQEWFSELCRTDVDDEIMDSIPQHPKYHPGPISIHKEIGPDGTVKFS